jgi:hypothetical protein
MEHGEHYSGVERRAPEAWKLKREISTGDLFIAASILIGLFLWGKGIETRIAVIEKGQEIQSRVDAAQDALVRDSVSRIESAVRDMQQLNMRAAAALK